MLALLPRSRTASRGEYECCHTTRTSGLSPRIDIMTKFLYTRADSPAPRGYALRLLMRS